MKSKVLGALFLVLVSAIIVGGVYYWQYGGFSRCDSFIVQTKCGINFEPSGETSNWKTYTNAQYGFEFKYPSYLSVTEGTSAASFSVDLWKDDSKLILSFTIDDSEKSENLITKIKNAGLKESIQIGNRTSYFDCRFVCDEDNVTESTGLIVFDSPASKQVLFIGYGNNNIKSAHQILSTFKFTK